MKRYLVTWDSAIEEGGLVPIIKQREFHDIQWKGYGARCTDDQNGGYTLLIPYTSIKDVQIISDEETEL